MTYSIVAFDPSTNSLGVAVQSKYLAVGSVVPWIRAGVGAIATQANGTRYYGRRGLELLGTTGREASEVLEELLSADDANATRQVGLVGPGLGAAAHTGVQCVQYASHHVTDNVAAQANLMRNEGVPEAMVSGYAEADGAPMARRLLAALTAAETAGGDLRGRQSAALIVVDNGRPTAWDNTVCDVRVDDDTEPLQELRRLIELQEGVGLVEALEAAASSPQGVLADIVARARRDEAILTADPEYAFWAGVSLFEAGDRDFAPHLLRSALASGPEWTELLRRLSRARRLQATPDEILRAAGAPVE